MWVNIAATALLFTEGLGQVMSGFTPVLGPWAIGFSFTIAVINVGLRTVTTQGVE